MVLAEGGKIVGRTLKHELPNYGTFDEKRIFASGPLPRADRVARGQARRRRSARTSGSSGCAPRCATPAPTCCSSPTAARSNIDKDDRRLAHSSARRATETGLPLAYLNRVGGQDEIVFDGSSFIVNDDGELVVQMTDWDEALARHRLGRGRQRLALRDARRSPRSIPIRRTSTTR